MVSNQAFIGPPAIGINENSRSEKTRLSFDISPSWLAARQKSARRFRASSEPPRARPSATITALIAPAEVPEMPSISTRWSANNSSSTPQVSAPCAPPPCSARLMRFLPFGLPDLSPPKARERNSIIECASLRHPAAVDRIGRTGNGRSRVAAQEYRQRANTLRLGK